MYKRFLLSANFIAAYIQKYNFGETEIHYYWSMGGDGNKPLYQENWQLTISSSLRQQYTDDKKHTWRVDSRYVQRNYNLLKTHRNSCS